MSILNAVTGEETGEYYEEEFMPEGGVSEDKIAAVDKNPIANETVDAYENVDAADNLPSDNDIDPPAAPAHFISHGNLDKTKVIDLEAILKERGFSIAGGKADPKLRLQEAVAAGI